MSSFHRVSAAAAAAESAACLTYLITFPFLGKIRKTKQKGVGLCLSISKVFLTKNKFGKSCFQKGGKN
jgi:hypothetical protein